MTSGYPSDTRFPAFSENETLPACMADLLAKLPLDKSSDGQIAVWLTNHFTDRNYQILVQDMVAISFLDGLERICKHDKSKNPEGLEISCFLREIKDDLKINNFKQFQLGG